MINIFKKQFAPNRTLGKTLITFYGISYMRAFSYCSRIGFPYNSLIKKLPISALYYVRKTLNKNFLPNPFIQRKISENLSFKIRNGSYSGFCFSNNLPSRGQRSKNNGKTAKRGLTNSFLNKFK